MFSNGNTRSTATNALTPSPTLLTLPPLDDFHLHLRQDALMEVVAPYVRQGGWYASIIRATFHPIFRQLSSSRDA